MLAKAVNDDAGNLDERRAWAFFASKLAPTVIVPAVTGSPTVQRTIKIKVWELACLRWRCVSQYIWH